MADKLAGRSYAIQTGVVPPPHTTSNGPAPTKSGKPGPNLFADPAAVFAAYSLPLAGDSGQRNGIRGDGLLGLDLGIGKRFNLFTYKDNPHTPQFRAESFNVTNSVRFDPYAASVNILNPARWAERHIVGRCGFRAWWRSRPGVRRQP